jgi:hypothetical protein
MATYTSSGGILICTGNDITSAGILDALQSPLSSTTGHFGATDNPKDIYYFNASIDIGTAALNGAQSIWNCSDEIIKINANRFRIYGQVIQGNLDGDSSESGGTFCVTGANNDAFRLYDNGVFRCYGSSVYAQGRIRCDTDSEWTTIDCDLELEDGVSVGESNSSFGQRQLITYDKSRIHHTGAVGVKLYTYDSSPNNAVYSLLGTKIEKCRYAFQLGASNNLTPILFDVEIDTCVDHLVPNLGSAEIIFINPDFTTLRVSGGNNGDVATIAFRYNFKTIDSNSENLSGVKVYIFDQSNSVVVNAESTDNSGLLNSFLPNYDGVPCLNNSTYANENKTDRTIHVRSVYKYNYLTKTDIIEVTQDIKDFPALLPNASITESDKSIVSSYSEIDTSNKFFDAAALFLEDQYGTYVEFIVTRSGNEINAGSHDVNIDAAASNPFTVISDGTNSNLTITIKASLYTGNMVTTGVITLLNGASFNGTRTDANGTIAPSSVVTLSGLISNSEIRIYEAGTTIEVAGIESSGTTFVDASIDVDSVDITIVSIQYEIIKIKGVDTTSNVSIPIQQRFDRNYRNP